MADDFVGDLTEARKTTTLPPVPRDPALDEKARAGLSIIEAGLPEGVSAMDHLVKVAALAEGLDYGIGFEEDTLGLDEAALQRGRSGGYTISDALLAGDPALDGVGWATGGPWAVLVLRARRLGPSDAPALLQALERAMQKDRPALVGDPALSSLGAEAVRDAEVNYDDVVGFGRARGVPVHLEYEESGLALPSSFLNIRLAKDGPGTLREAWLDRAGVAVQITDSGTVAYVVLASGETDHAALVAEIATAEPKAAELVNLRRRGRGLPPFRSDPVVVAAARSALADWVYRGCAAVSDLCSSPFPKVAKQMYASRDTWYSPDSAFTWYMDDQDGRTTYKHFGAAATIGPDGTVWSVLLLAD